MRKVITEKVTFDQRSEEIKRHHVHILGRSISSKVNHKCKNLVIGTFMYCFRTSKDVSRFEAA